MMRKTDNPIETLLGIYGLMLLVFVGGMIYVGSPDDKATAQQPQVIQMAEPKNPVVTTSGNDDRFYANYRDESLVGRYTNDGLSIAWQGNADHGATPLSVIEATIHRMQFEQTTDLASNQNARAMALLLQAKTVLQGGQETTDDGTPIIE